MEAAGLTDLLKQEGDFTLFAPSDKAFAVLDDRELAFLKSRSLRLISSFIVPTSTYSMLLVRNPRK